MNRDKKKKIRKALRFLQYLVLSLDNIQNAVDATGASKAQLLVAFQRQSVLGHKAALARRALAEVFDYTIADGEVFNPSEKMMLHVDHWRWPGRRATNIALYEIDDLKSLNIPSIGPATERLLRASCFIETLVVSLARIGSCVDDPDEDEEEIVLRFYEDFDIHRRAVEARDALSSCFESRVPPGRRTSELQRTLTGVRPWRVSSGLWDRCLRLFDDIFSR